MRIHILGICGTFMGGIAAIARAAGHRVSGCDANVYPPMSTQLEALGIELTDGYDAAQLDGVARDADVFVIGNVVSRGNPLMEAILDHAGLAPGFLIGGVPANFGVSARQSGSAFFVVEADEYDTAFFDKRSKFVHYRPTTAILNNLEYDHADIFPDLAAIETQFHHLLRTVPGTSAKPKRSTSLQQPRASTRASAASAPFTTSRPSRGTVRTRWWNCVSIAARSGKMSAWSYSRLLRIAVDGR